MRDFEINKRIKSRKDYILIAKIRNFLKRSIFNYLIASLLIAVAKPSLFGNFTYTACFIFTVLCLLSLILIVISSSIQAKRMQFDADITFTTSEIIITHKNKDLIEKKNWDWILNAEENKHSFYLLIQKNPRLELILHKRNFNREEIAALQEWIKK